ncbi:MAG: hypothetical protein IJW21_05745, partial [Clostridia bacterium]|nr:hypothetical protein [Clostridia bacterium]
MSTIFRLTPLGELRAAVRGLEPQMQIFDIFLAFGIALSVTSRCHLSHRARLKLLFRQPWPAYFILP